MGLLMRPTAERRLLRFLLSTPLACRIILLAVAIGGSCLAYFYDSRPEGLLSRVWMPPWELMGFFLMALTDLRRSEQQGSIFLLVSCILKNSLLATIWLISSLIHFDLPLSPISLPIQYCFWIAVSEACSAPCAIKYFLLPCFQIKAFAYPLLMAFLFSVAHPSVEWLLVALLSVAWLYGRVDLQLRALLKGMESRESSERWAQWGFIRHIDHRKDNHRDIREITINDSIVLDGL